MKSRRQFLSNALSAGLPVAMLPLLSSAQSSRDQRPQPPGPKDEEAVPPKPDPKLILEANQKDIKKSVEKLFDLASELKDEVEKTNSVQVLSVNMLRRTEEIERLAKEIRTKAKG